MVAGALAYPTLRVLIALKSRQTVSEFAPAGHQAKQGTPTMGGIMVVLAIVVGMLAWQKSNIALPIVLLFGLIGFGDDYVLPKLMPGKRGLGWKQKLILEIVGVALPVALMLEGGLAIKVWAVFLVLFFANAYNFSDGQDGLAAGLGLILFGSFWVLGVGGGVALASAIAVGALIPFAVVNWPPAKVFMGDVGSLPLGALVGLGFFEISTHALSGLSLASWLQWDIAGVVLSLVMMAELLPVPMQIFWVKVFKKKLFPYTPIHHAFERAGWKETRVTAMFIFIQLGLALAAIGIALPLIGQHQGH